MNSVEKIIADQCIYWEKVAQTLSDLAAVCKKVSLQLQETEKICLERKSCEDCISQQISNLSISKREYE